MPSPCPQPGAEFFLSVVKAVVKEKAQKVKHAKKFRKQENPPETLRFQADFWWTIQDLNL